MDDRTGRRELYSGYGDTLTRGVEMAITPFLVAAIGYLIDRVAGTVPVFTIVFGVIGLVGVGLHTYYTYEARMRLHDTAGPWAKRGRSVGGGGGPS